MKKFRLARLILLAVCSLCLMLLGPGIVTGQCSEHPLGKTAIKFSNETHRDLTFFIDRDETGIFVPSYQISNERPVAPGTHLLRAIAKINDKEVWVWVINEFPAGQVCIWTVADPAISPKVVNRGKYSTLAIETDAPALIEKR